MELLGVYKNGNYNVKMFSDGTKIRETEDDEFIPSFVESHDICITKKCDGGCPYCYEGCTIDGKHADIMNAKFLDSLHPLTEIAINGNDLSHPDLIPFLKMMKEKNIIVSMTVNQLHFERKEDMIRQLVDDKLIYGLGISLRNTTDEFIARVQKYSNAVIHCIHGITTKDDFVKMMDCGLKVLILGYKYLRRGEDYYDKESPVILENQAWLYHHLHELLNHFDVVSFDNLAITQLALKRFMTNEEWEEFYMGDDGKFSFYIDMVENQFSRNSLSRKRYDVRDNIDDMFGIIKKEEKPYEK